MNFSLINSEYSVGHTMALKQTTNLSSSESFIQFRITCDNFKTGHSLALLRYDFEFVASLLLYKTRLTHSLPSQIEKMSKNCVHVYDV